MGRPKRLPRDIPRMRSRQIYVAPQQLEFHTDAAKVSGIPAARPAGQETTMDRGPLPPRDAPAPTGRPEGCRRIALVLQGGGALGAYQGGVYQALHEAGLEPDWIAGVSIGGINGAIIAGNPPERRLERLREFWELITSRHVALHRPDGDNAHKAHNVWSSMLTTMLG